jgi:CRISPR system Cascade subunit CasA
MGRVCLLVEGGVVVIEGIQHPNYLDGRRDLTVSADLTGAKTKVLWSNTNKGPWRELTSILSFVSAKSGSSFENTQIKLTLGRARHMGGLIGVWSGGQKISFKTGEHYMTGLDDYVDSMTWLNVDEIGEPWFIQLETEMAILDRIAKIVFICVEKYFLSNGFQKPKKGHLMVASRASSQYWDKVSNIFFEMINLFGHHSEIDTVSKKRRQATHLANEIYNSFCPRLTARQLQGWAEHKPNFNSILRGS